MDEQGFKRLQMAVDWAVQEFWRKPGEAPEEGIDWQQGTWGRAKFEDFFIGKGQTHAVARCASACCIAGNIAIAEGAQFVVSQSMYESARYYDHPMIDVTEAITLDNQIVEVDEYAAKLLGVSYDEAQGLFAGSNNLSNVIFYAGRLAEKYGFELDTSSYPSLA